tara:strand:- start:76283 stop:76681 length:399 start_codon:yes stop_codon:yes gene_type:complete
MTYIKLIGSTLIASGVLGSGAFAQDVSEPSDINFDSDYERIAVYQTTDEELLQKVKRYINSKKKEARILKAESDQDIQAIKKRARQAGTEEAKQAARIAIQDQKNQLKRELYSIRADVKQIIKRARNAAQNS